MHIPTETKSSKNIADAIGIGIQKITYELLRLKPDILILLGDRHETFAAGISAMLTNIPIAHLYGGELTLGAIDDAMRHSITKMSQLHFASTKEYVNRIIQMGENPQRVSCVGALGTYNIKTIKLLSKNRLEKILGLTFAKHNLLATFHPATLEQDNGFSQFKKLLNILKDLKETQIIFTYANADKGGARINREIDKFISKYPDCAIVFKSMGQLHYLSTLQYVNATIGNSSSGIIETPSFKIGAINIGDRQKGRILADNIIQCKPTSADNKKALKKHYSPTFQKKLKKVKNPFEQRDTPHKIIKVLKKIKINNITQKKFYNIPVTTKKKSK